MFNLENKIRKRHRLDLKKNDRFSKQKNQFINRLFRSIIAPSNIIYWGLIGGGILLVFIK